MSSSEAISRGATLLTSPTGHRKLTVDHQRTAAWFILPRTTVGFCVLLATFWYYLGHRDDLREQHYDLLAWPTAAYATALLLWYRYDFGVRRYVDMVVISSTVAMCTFNCLYAKCSCPWHRAVYFVLWVVGNMAYVRSRKTDDWLPALQIHFCCHLIGYACTMLLYRCVACEAG